MFTFFLSLPKRRLVVACLALLLLSGCGLPQNLSASTPVQPIPTPVAPLSGPLATSIAFDLGGWLHIQSISGLVCENGFSTDPPGMLILPTVQQTYDQGTLQPVENYMTTLVNNTGDWNNSVYHRDTVPYPAFPANSSAFQLLPVADASDPASSCNEILHITNIGNAPVQISQISVQFTADTQIDNRHYNLINGCSLLTEPCPFTERGGEGNYDAFFRLSAGKAYTKIKCDCSGTLTLQPGEVTKVVWEYLASDNLSFSLVPSFILTPLGGDQTTYIAPQLQAAFAFTSQFSCYTLRGQQFIEVSLKSNWCI